MVIMAKAFGQLVAVYDISYCDDSLSRIVNGICGQYINTISKLNACKHDLDSGTWTKC